MHRLQTQLGVGGAVLSWFVSYATYRSKRVSVNGVMCDVFDLSSGVPQGSCLGPLMCSIYASKTFDVIWSPLQPQHAYADGTQLYFSLCANIIDGQTATLSAMEHSISDIRSWMNHNKLKLNDEKTNSYSLVHVNKFLLTRLRLDLWMFLRLAKPKNLCVVWFKVYNVYLLW